MFIVIRAGYRRPVVQFTYELAGGVDELDDDVRLAAVGLDGDWNAKRQAFVPATIRSPTSRLFAAVQPKGTLIVVSFATASDSVRSIVPPRPLTIGPATLSMCATGLVEPHPRA